MINKCFEVDEFKAVQYVYLIVRTCPLVRKTGIFTESVSRVPSFQMVVDDIYAIGKGRLIGRPR
ncbi:hypothetical protein JCM17380_54350 [Desulfosporosinus burensis]